MKRLVLGALITTSIVVTGCTSNDTTDKSQTQDTTQQEQESNDTSKQNELSTEKPEPFDSDIKNNSLAVSPDEKIAIASNSTLSNIKVYNLEEKKLIGEIDSFVTPRNISFSKDGSKFYISDSSYGTIREYDSSSLKELRSFDVGQGVFGFTLNNAGNKIYANNQAKDSVTVINLTDGKIEKVVTGFSGPRQGIVIDKNDKYVYVTNFKGDDVRVLNTETLEIEKTLSGIPSVRAISIDTDKNILYGASSSENTINVLDVNTGEVIKSIPVGEEPYGSKLSPDGKTILTGEKVSNQVSVIDTETLEVKNTIKGLNEPRQAIVYSKSNEGNAYVLNADLSISIIDYNGATLLENIK